ncbi:hypothetical protein OT109_15525 [Phycisphaeraceae bacterium D3-23]
MAHTPLITVTAFGKHPAWADHIDSVPAPGPSLPRFKSLLYTNGIAPNVQRWTRPPRAGEADEVNPQVLDSDQADDAASLIRLDHLLSWYTPEALVVGKLVPSTDQKGRRSYPFVLAVQCEGAGARWVRQTLWPTLAPLAQRCRETPERDALQGVLDEHAAALNESLATAARGVGTPTDDASPPIPGGVAALRALSRALGDEPGEDPPVALLRFLYQVRRVTHAAPRPEDWSALHLRVPLVGGETTDDLTLWQNAARHMTGDKIAVLALAPADRAWIDLILGPAEASHFLCLRRSDLPHCTDIAYTLSPEDRQALHGILEGEYPLPITKETGSGIFSRRADPPSGVTTLSPASPDSASGSADPAPPAQTKRPSNDRHIHFMLWGIIALALLIAMLLVVLFQNS